MSVFAWCLLAFFLHTTVFVPPYVSASVHKSVAITGSSSTSKADENTQKPGYENISKAFLSKDAMTIYKRHVDSMKALSRMVASASGAFEQMPWGFMTRAGRETCNDGFAMAVITAPLDEKGLQEMQKDAQSFFKEAPYELWIDNQNAGLEHVLFEERAVKRGDYPGKFLALKKKFDTPSFSHLRVSYVYDDKTAKDWAFVTSSVYNLNPHNLYQFAKRVMHLPYVVLYIGYDHDAPATSRLMLVSGDQSTGYTASGHFSATLPQHRRKGYASYLTRYSLNDMIDRGVSLFVNQASPKSAHMWHKLGMNDYGNMYRCFLMNMPRVGS